MREDIKEPKMGGVILIAPIDLASISDSSRKARGCGMADGEKERSC